MTLAGLKKWCPTTDSGRSACRPRLTPTALAMEVFHKASLVHDDIQDNDPYRYGQETLHRRYGVGTAINVGDYLIGMGYRPEHVAQRLPKLGSGQINARGVVLASAVTLVLLFGVMDDAWASATSESACQKSTSPGLSIAAVRSVIAFAGSSFRPSMTTLATLAVPI